MTHSECFCVNMHGDSKQQLKVGVCWLPTFNIRHNDKLLQFLDTVCSLHMALGIMRHFLIVSIRLGHCILDKSYFFYFLFVEVPKRN